MMSDGISVDKGISAEEAQVAFFEWQEEKRKRGRLNGH